jgi:hypothetical protein
MTPIIVLVIIIMVKDVKNHVLILVLIVNNVIETKLVLFVVLPHFLVNIVINPVIVQIKNVILMELVWMKGIALIILFMEKIVKKVVMRVMII